MSASYELRVRVAATERVAKTPHCLTSLLDSHHGVSWLPDTLSLSGFSGSPSRSVCQFVVFFSELEDDKHLAATPHNLGSTAWWQCFEGLMLIWY